MKKTILLFAITLSIFAYSSDDDGNNDQTAKDYSGDYVGDKFEKSQNTYHYKGTFVSPDRIGGTWTCTKNGNQSSGTFWAAK